MLLTLILSVTVPSWQLVVEHENGHSDIVDYNMSYDDCMTAADKAIIDYPNASVIYCEIQGDTE